MSLRAWPGLSLSLSLPPSGQSPPTYTTAVHRDNIIMDELLAAAGVALFCASPALAMNLKLANGRTHSHKARAGILGVSLSLPPSLCGDGNIDRGIQVPKLVYARGSN